MVTFLTCEMGPLRASAGRPQSCAAGKAHQPVVSGVLVCFAPRWNGERRVDEPVDHAFLVHHELPDVDELAGNLSNDVYP